MFGKLLKMDGLIILLFEHEVGGQLWLDEVNIDSFEILGPYLEVLFSLKKTLNKVLGIFKLFIRKIVLVQIMRIFFRFEVLLLLEMIFIGTVVEQNELVLEIEG